MAINNTEKTSIDWDRAVLKSILSAVHVIETHANTCTLQWMLVLILPSIRQIVPRVVSQTTHVNIEYKGKITWLVAFPMCAKFYIYHYTKKVESMLLLLAL